MESKLSLNDLSENLSTESSANSVKENQNQDPFDSGFPTFSSRSKCLLAYVCLVLNFSSVIRFCYSLGVYGSAIFIPYIIFKLLIGASLILLEVTVGRYVTGYLTKIYSYCLIAKGILVCVFLSTCLDGFLNFIELILLFKYLTSFYRGGIVWDQCKEPWAKVNCYLRKDNVSAYQKCINEHSYDFCQNLKWETSGRQYWQYVIVNTSSLKSVAFSIVFLFLAIIAVILINYKGIRSLEKSFLIFLIAPIILGAIRTLVTFLTPGSVFGFLKVWFLDVSLLIRPEIWVRGLEDTMINFKIGLFALPFISSHGKFVDDIFYDVLTVVFSDVFCLFILTLPILTMVEIVSDSHPPFKDYVDTYVWISEALIAYPYPNSLWACLFYLEMTLMQLGSQSIICLSVFEVVFSIIKDVFSSINATYICVALGLASFFLSIPAIFFPIFDFCPLGTVVLVVVFLSVVNFQLFYGIRKFNDDFHFMMGYHPPFLFSSAQFLSTAIILIFITIKLVLGIPPEPITYAIYLYAGIPILLHVLVAIIEIIRASKEQNALTAFMENPDWGPSPPLLRKSRIVFDSKTVTKEFMYRQELYKKPLMQPNNFTDQNIVHLI